MLCAKCHCNSQFFWTWMAESNLHLNNSQLDNMYSIMLALCKPGFDPENVVLLL